jgi:hypothetical protein
LYVDLRDSVNAAFESSPVPVSLMQAPLTECVQKCGCTIVNATSGSKS